MDDLLDFVIEFGLRADDVEAVDQLGHDLARVVSVFGRHHAHQQHDSFDEARVLEVQIDDQALKHVLMLFDQVLTELLEQLSVPLDDGLLLLASLPLHLLILLFQPVENVLEFVAVGQDLDDSAEEAPVNVLDEALAINVVNLFGVFQAQNSRNDVWELELVHGAKKLFCGRVQVLRLVPP